MRKWLPVLALLAGLGSLISCKPAPAATAKPTTETQKLSDSAPEPHLKAQRAPGTGPLPAVSQDKVDPFDRYLAVEKAHGHEAELTRFASECEIDLSNAKPRYAQRPGEVWKIVPDLSKAKDDLETDFYGTVAVWHQADRILTEEWGMELDTGDFYRLMYCLDNKKIRLAESTSWKLADFGDNVSDTDWGYEVQWKRGPDGKFGVGSRRFVDLDEKPMATPKLDEEALKGLQEESVGAKTWSDLRFPKELLQ
jgi:hypothetical protein